MAYDVLVRPDIDIEVTCKVPDIVAGFAIMAEVAQIPGVRRIRFANELDGPDQGLYWHIRYRENETARVEEWTIDIWLLPYDHPGPRSLDLVEPMRASMSEEVRLAILRLKEHFRDQDGVHGIDIYRAVIDGNVRSVEAFERWEELNHRFELTDWRPRR
jgi:hypothetical protein